jgi:geranyl-CoA carboxylase alpha subunit
MIRTILIANRGEIACRIIRTCHKLGIRTVAIYSDADAQARHVQLADEAVYIGASPASESYLAIDKMINATQRTDADAIHPGFGFLAENAQFARVCHEAGLIFIGPTPEAIEAMGSKSAAKSMMQTVDVPVILGYNGADQSDDRLLHEAENIGFPLMVKAAAGGGGKGMRLVTEIAQLKDALQTARREAKQAFGSDELILERALTRPRHIEIQVIGDHFGNIIHLGERECSIQRRHQKVVEESPSPVMTPELRDRMGADAIKAAQAVKYTNVGTVEFLLDSDGRHYFLEMNTRLQVEHPVTELVTGLDLVEWQIRIAENEPLPQKQVSLQGHAIEVRLYAENPANQFLPVTGDIHLWREPVAENIRVDSGLNSPTDDVSIYYDPMLAKIIAYGENRSSTIRRLTHALENTILLGITNNRSFLLDILRHPAFQKGDLSTNFIDQHFQNWTTPQADKTLALIAVTLWQHLRHPQLESNAGYWRNNPNAPERYRYQVENEEHLVLFQPVHRTTNHYEVQINDNHDVHINTVDAHHFTLTVDGHRQTVIFAHAEDQWWVQTKNGVVEITALPRLPMPKSAADAAGSLRAPMPGSVTQVLVEVGQHVAKGQALMKLEAMKMEHTIYTAAPGIVEVIYFQAGETVEADVQLVKIAEEN